MKFGILELFLSTALLGITPIAASAAPISDGVGDFLNSIPIPEVEHSEDEYINHVEVLLNNETSKSLIVLSGSDQMTLESNTLSNKILIEGEPLCLWCELRPPNFLLVNLAVETEDGVKLFDTYQLARTTELQKVQLRFFEDNGNIKVEIIK